METGFTRDCLSKERNWEIGLAVKKRILLCSSVRNCNSSKEQELEFIQAVQRATGKTVPTSRRQATPEVTSHCVATCHTIEKRTTSTDEGADPAANGLARSASPDPRPPSTASAEPSRRCAARPAGAEPPQGTAKPPRACAARSRGRVRAAGHLCARTGGLSLPHAPGAATPLTNGTPVRDQDRRLQPACVRPTATTTSPLPDHQPHARERQTATRSRARSPARGGPRAWRAGDPQSRPQPRSGIAREQPAGTRPAALPQRRGAGRQEDAGEQGEAEGGGA